jgi:beta-N-acetylhexosaminidase
MSAGLERLAAACIFPSFPGFEAPDWILRRLEGGIGGICLFSYNVRDREQLAELTGVLRAGRHDLLIGIDEEGGEVTRLESDRGSSYPGNAALGAVDDVASTVQVAAAIGADLAAVGVNLDFAPVADINVNPDNPVIGVRSFGTDADIVARHVAAFVTGLQSQGVAACAKHFPGHGSTSQDSHLELPTVLGDVRDGLEPFGAAIAAGVQTMMTAHVLVPGLDSLPATLSHAVMTGLLRDELGYEGLVIADALEMKGVSATVGVERSAVLALAAGVDALLIGHDLHEEWVVAVQAALVEAVVSGELPESRLREAAGRVARVGAWANRTPGVSAIDRGVGRDVARGALRSDGDLALREPPLVVELRPRANIAAGEAGHSIGSVLMDRLPGADCVVLEEVAASDVEATLARRAGKRVVVVVRDAHRHPWMREATAAMLAAAPGSLVVEIGLPVWHPDGAAGYLATLGGSRVSYEVLADYLVGDNGNGAAR